MLIWGAYEIGGRAYVGTLAIVPANPNRPGIIESYIVGALFISHIVGFYAISPAFRAIAARIEKPVRWAAGATFTIYLLHLPVAQFLITQTPGPLESGANRAIVLGGTLLVLFILAELTERRKAPWKRAFQALLVRSRGSQPAM